VDSVLEGLPAEKAGLKVHDIIVAIDGDKPVSQDRLREILRTKKPGDTIKLSVISKGKQEDIKVKLEAYDPEKLGAGGQMTFQVPGEMNLPFNVEGMQGLEGLFAQGWAEARPKLDEAKRAIEQSLAELKESGELNADNMKEHAIEALSKALRSLEEASGSAARRLEMMRPRSAEGDQGAVERRRAQRPQVYITPMPGGGQSDQLDRLTETLERMEKRLAELEKRLERRPRDKNGDER
ncbi:MAG: PDZ domain-containing protein, partial [Phycisphaerales bacterium]|nr:PDZ domain-containing protein [Phycisphaerales bacterium]